MKYNDQYRGGQPRNPFQIAVCRSKDWLFQLDLISANVSRHNTGTIKIT